MRFKKGAMVEVFCKTDNPAGSWRCAEIIGGNGHSFVVKYHSRMNKESVDERVPRKFIRPSSPEVGFLENWKSGDVIEVLHNFSWKMATVSRVLCKGKFLVKLVGFFDEFEVSVSDIRLRQSWVDGKWVVIGKSGMNNGNKRSQKESLKHNRISWSQISRPSSKINLQQKPVHVMYEKNINFQNSSKPPTRMIKRKSPNHYYKAEACRQKFRKNEKDGNRYPDCFDNISQVLEKVKVNTFDRDVLGENIFPNGRMRILSGINEARESEDDVECSPSVSSGLYENHDATCSTSCSSVCSNDPFNWHPTTLEHPVEVEKDYSSDAESICWSYNEDMSGSSFTKEEMAAEIHRLELHAYRCTMKALYASGPLSWEQESLITNLRISLHISNDEHLMELRILISNSSNSPIS
ncbi:hypothetical protein LIER_17731 [Lithospermum erythrorhizon]|uniref:ENT domain-containing protein n=1 Tax=Lithospermum erythrorhizon TaxID=34254 RepID=A0AAV3QBC9_LITER